MADSRSPEEIALDDAFTTVVGNKLKNLIDGLLTPLDFVTSASREPDYATAKGEFCAFLRSAREARDFALSLTTSEAERHSIQEAYLDTLGDRFVTMVDNLYPLGGSVSTGSGQVVEVSPAAMKEMFQHGFEIAQQARMMAIGLLQPPPASAGPTNL